MDRKIKAVQMYETTQTKLSTSRDQIKKLKNENKRLNKELTSMDVGLNYLKNERDVL